MAQKTANLKQDVESTSMGEGDAQEFIRRLEEFSKSLPEREQAIISQMVVEALGEESASSNGQDSKPEPTQEEIDSFTGKLNEFHDELPGDMHLFVDDLLATTWFKEQAEVQGYSHEFLVWRGLVPNKQRFWYGQQCFARPGEQTFQWKKKGGPWGRPHLRRLLGTLGAHR